MKIFRFNKEQLRFIEERISIGGRIGKVIKYFLASVVMSLIYYTIFSLLFDSGKAHALREENRMLSSEYRNIMEKMDLVEGSIMHLKERDRELYKLIFNAEPPTVFENMEREEYYLQIDTADFDKSVKNTTAVVERVCTESEEICRLMEKIEKSLEGIGSSATHLPSKVPLMDFVIEQTGASFGKKINPFYKTVRDHNGIDLLAPTGTFVLASADGVVAEVKRDRVLGKYLIIDHNNGYKTKYCYLGEILVPKGKRVRQGSAVARVGTSGMSFAPHLHYEVEFHGKALDPLNFFFADLTPQQIREMMVTSMNTGQSLD